MQPFLLHLRAPGGPDQTRSHPRDGSGKCASAPASHPAGGQNAARLSAYSPSNWGQSDTKAAAAATAPPDSPAHTASGCGQGFFQWRGRTPLSSIICLLVCGLQPCDCLAQVAAEVGERTIKNGAARDKNIGALWPGASGEVLQCKRTQAPLGPVAVNGTFAELAAGGKANPIGNGDFRVKGDRLQDKSRCCRAFPLFGRTHKIAATCQRNQCGSGGSDAQCLGAKALAALGAAAAQHVAPANGCHACPKAMTVFTHENAGLVGPFHDGFSLAELE